MAVASRALELYQAIEVCRTSLTAILVGKPDEAAAWALQVKAAGQAFPQNALMLREQRSDRHNAAGVRCRGTAEKNCSFGAFPVLTLTQDGHFPNPLVSKYQGFVRATHDDRLVHE